MTRVLRVRRRVGETTGVAGLPVLRSLRIPLLSLALVVAMSSAWGAQAAQPGDLYVVTIAGSINPASADYLIGAIEAAEEAEASAILIELDTPGGLVSATQDIIRAMLNSTVPTIVYVTPRGATATSAGTFITLAAHVAAMMPGTSIGAAHPVSLFGGGSSPQPTGKEGEEGAQAQQDVMGQKVENFLAAYVESIAKQRNRNVEWAQDAVRNSVAVTAEEALELNVIDLVVAIHVVAGHEQDGRGVEPAKPGERYIAHGFVAIVEGDQGRPPGQAPGVLQSAKEARQVKQLPTFFPERA